MPGSSLWLGKTRSTPRLDDSGSSSRGRGCGGGRLRAIAVIHGAGESGVRASLALPTGNCGVLGRSRGGTSQLAPLARNKCATQDIWRFVVWLGGNSHTETLTYVMWRFRACHSRHSGQLECIAEDILATTEASSPIRACHKTYEERVMFAR